MCPNREQTFRAGRQGGCPYRVALWRAVARLLFGLRFRSEGASDAAGDVGRIDDAAEGLTTAAREAGDSLDGATESTSRFSGGLGKAKIAAAGLAVAAVAGLKSVISSAFESAGEIEKLTTATGLSKRALQEYRSIAGPTGGTIDDVADASRELTLRLTEAKELQSGPAVDALRLLGLEYRDLANLNADERFGLIRQRLSEEEDQARRTLIAEELLGGSTERLAGLIGLTSEAFEQQREAAHAAGVILESEQIDKTNRARLAWDGAKASLSAAAGALTASLAPALEGVANIISSTLVPAVGYLTQAVADFEEGGSRILQWGRDADDWLHRNTYGVLGYAKATEELGHTFEQLGDLQQHLAEAQAEHARLLEEASVLTTDLDLAVDAYWATTGRAAQGTKTLTSALYDEQAALLAVESAANSAWQAHLRLASAMFEQTFGQVGLYGSIAPVIGVPLGPDGHPIDPAGGGAGGGGGGGAGGGGGGAGGGGGGSRVLGARATGGTRRNRESSGASSKRSKPDRREELLARLAVLAPGRGFRGRSLAVLEAIVAQFESAESTRVRKTAAAIAYPEAAAAAEEEAAAAEKEAAARTAAAEEEAAARTAAAKEKEASRAEEKAARAAAAKEKEASRAEEAAARAAAAKEKEAARAAAAEEAAAARAEEEAARAEEVAAQEATDAATLASLGAAGASPGVQAAILSRLRADQARRAREKAAAIVDPEAAAAAEEEEAAREEAAAAREEAAAARAEEVAAQEATDAATLASLGAAGASPGVQAAILSRLRADRARQDRETAATYFPAPVVVVNVEGNIVAEADLEDTIVSVVSGAMRSGEISETPPGLGC